MSALAPWRSAMMALAAGRVPATLPLFVVGTLAAVPTATIGSAEAAPQQEEQPVPRACADMPTARSHMTVSALGGKIYAIGGSARLVAGAAGSFVRCWRCTTPPRIDGHGLRTCRLRAPCLCLRAVSSTGAST
jgi:hypothetical protein